MEALKPELSIFINCPFDEGFRPLLRAMQFTILLCGYTPRSALEEDNAGEVRVGKIMRLIRDDCRMGIHDISRTERDGSPPLPRFNMPFELGLHLGSVWTRSSPDRSACILILDRERYRYQRLLSDISGQDIRSHGGTPGGMISAVRKWLSAQKKREVLFGTATLQKYFAEFSKWYPRELKLRGWTAEDVGFASWSDLMIDWLARKLSKTPSRCPACGK